MPKSLKDLVANAKTRIREISASDTAAAAKQDPRLLIVDVREPAEWAEGHIPGALLVPRGMLEAKADLEYANREPRLAESRAGDRLALRERRPQRARRRRVAGHGFHERALDGWRHRGVEREGSADREVTVTSRAASPPLPQALARGRTRSSARETLAKDEAARRARSSAANTATYVPSRRVKSQVVGVEQHPVGAEGPGKPATTRREPPAAQPGTDQGVPAHLENGRRGEDRPDPSSHRKTSSAVQAEALVGDAIEPSPPHCIVKARIPSPCTVREGSHCEKRRENGLGHSGMEGASISRTTSKRETPE